MTEFRNIVYVMKYHDMKYRMWPHDIDDCDNAPQMFMDLGDDSPANQQYVRDILDAAPDRIRSDIKLWLPNLEWI